MRTSLLVAATLYACATFAQEFPSDRPATDLEADRIYLDVLNSTPYDEALEMLTDTGVPDAKARELLAYLAEHIEDHVSVNRADVENMCRNADDQFSNPIGLAAEIRRQKAAELEFQDSMLKRALEILGVASLTPIRRPHMNNGGLTDTEIVERILDGRLNPADAISRSCEILKQYQSPPLPEGKGH